MGRWQWLETESYVDCITHALQGASAEEVVKTLTRQMPHSSAAALVLPRDLSVACNHAMSSAQQLALNEMQQVATACQQTESC